MAFKYFSEFAPRLILSTNWVYLKSLLISVTISLHPVNRESCPSTRVSLRSCLIQMRSTARICGMRYLAQIFQR